MNKQRHCVGCDRSLEELMQESNDFTISFNKSRGRNDPVMTDADEVLEQPETVFTNSGEWYCHSDCYRDCH